jgi:hypothetical protein
MDLASNSLSGQIPESIGNLSAMAHCYSYSDSLEDLEGFGMGETYTYINALGRPAHLIVL